MTSSAIKKPTVLSLLEQLKSPITRIQSASFTSEGYFRCVVRAALAKAYEFATAMQGEQTSPFFCTATMRGICEDLIVLSFVGPLSDRDELIMAMNTKNLAEGLASQTAFFKTHRPWQPTLVESAGILDKAKAGLKTIALRHGWTNGKLPTVRAMADATGDVVLYDYMYAATSKWVHCSPHILLRMGWTKEPTNRTDLCETTRWFFSTNHFDAYYREFNGVYSVYLLKLLSERFIGEFDSQAEVQEILVVIDRYLGDTLRWPELVTYEEMNADSPGTIHRILLRAAHEADSESTTM